MLKFDVIFLLSDVSRSLTMQLRKLHRNEKSHRTRSIIYQPQKLEDNELLESAQMNTRKYRWHCEDMYGDIDGDAHQYTSFMIDLCVVSYHPTSFKASEFIPHKSKY